MNLKEGTRRLAIIAGVPGAAFGFYTGAIGANEAISYDPEHSRNRVSKTWDCHIMIHYSVGIHKGNRVGTARF